MMGIFLILLVIIYLYILSRISYKLLGNDIIGAILAFVFVFTLAGFVTYTPDWEGYETWISFNSGRDLIFNFIVNQTLIHNIQIGYQQVHLIYTFCYSFLLVFFINKLCKDSFAAVLLYLPLVFLYYVTQIRFFLGFFSICLSAYYWYVEKKNIYSFLFCSLAILSHLSFLLVLPLMLLFKMDTRDLLKRVALLSFIFFGFYEILNLADTLLPAEARFSSYVMLDNESTFLGGLFSFLPYIVSLVTLEFLVQKYLKTNRIKPNDDVFDFLYKLSVIPYVLIWLSLYIQIIGQRFISSIILIHILLFFYMLRDMRSYNIKIGVAFIYVGIFLYTYVLSIIVAGSVHAERVLQILYSNYLIKGIL